MQSPTPYIHIIPRTSTPIESGDFDQLGVVFEHVDGYHALFAAQVSPRSYESVEAHKWGWTSHQLLLEVLDRQRRFITSLYRLDSCGRYPNRHLRTIAMRYFRRQDHDTIDLVLLGKVFAETADRVRQLALEWWQEISALFTYDCELVPVASSEAYEELSGSSYLEKINPTTDLAEIRRHEIFVPKPTGQAVMEGDYLVFPFVWHPNAMEQVWRAMALLPCASLVNVTLRPTYLYEAEEIHLNQLLAAAQQLASSDRPMLRTQGQVAARLYETYLSRLLHPFLMRVQIASQRPGRDALAQAVGTALTYAPLMQTELSPEAFSVPYDIATPTSHDLSQALENLRTLEFHSWGDDQAAAPYRRFRYLFDAAGAHCAFRLPFMPRHGLPGIHFTHVLPSDDVTVGKA
jgi:hypothetical protein